jgi:hypothetical protein
MMGHVSLPPNMCIYYSSPLLVVFVLISDSVFSLLLLALFMLPMFTMGQMLSNMAGSSAPDLLKNSHSTQRSQIQRTVRRQLALSLVALLSTLAVTIFLTIVNPMSGYPSVENLGSQYWRVVGGWTFVFDCIMQSISIHLITNACKLFVCAAVGICCGLPDCSQCSLAWT